MHANSRTPASRVRARPRYINIEGMGNDPSSAIDGHCEIKVWGGKSEFIVDFRLFRGSRVANGLARSWR